MKFKICYFGHIIKGSKYELPKLIIQENIEGQRRPEKNENDLIAKYKIMTGLETTEKLIKGC